MSKKSRQDDAVGEIGTKYKLLVVRERLKGTPEKNVAAGFRVSAAAVAKWTSAFRRPVRRRSRSSVARPVAQPFVR